MTSNLKEFKIRRATADKLLKGLTERIAEYNDNPYKPYYVKRAVVFGSYVNNPGREMLSDLDIGINLDLRYDDDALTEILIRSDCLDILSRHPSYDGRWGKPLYPILLSYRGAVRFLRNRSPYISIHKIGSDSTIFSGVTKEIDIGAVNRNVFGVPS